MSNIRASRLPCAFRLGLLLPDVVNGRIEVDKVRSICLLQFGNIAVLQQIRDFISNCLMCYIFRLGNFFLRITRFMSLPVGVQIPNF
jgi:hypothetical protein